jgi:hypothetical protein
MPNSWQTGSTSAHEQRVRRLLADEPLPTAPFRRPLRGDDLARRIGRRSDRAHLPGADEIRERAECLVVVGVEIPAMDLVKVDPVGAEPAQTRVALPDEPAAGVAALVHVVAHHPVRLRRQHDSITAALERFAHDLLRLAARVDVGRVDEVDPRVERAVDDPDRFLVIGIAPGAEHHRAEAERADLHSGGPQRAVVHLETVSPAAVITSS